MSYPMPTPGHQDGYPQVPSAPNYGANPPPYDQPQPMPHYGPPTYPLPQGQYPHPPNQQPPILNQPGPGYPGGQPGTGYAGGQPGPGYPGGQYQPIPTQPPAPVDGNWMSIPRGFPNCPPGLEYLTMIDQLLVHQKVELLEAFTGFETKNKFTIKNSLGQKVYYAVEDSDCCTRNCCGPMRPFDMKILDNYKTEVIHLNRPLACDSCCFPCCLQSMEVSSPPGTVIGTVEQDWSICCPSYSIKNASGEVILKIDGPFCTWSICGDVEFKVMSADGQHEVGKISKQWSGLAREVFTDADFFGITFPMDLDVRMKAVMLGACFLIDAMFFEKSRNRENDRIGMI